MKGRMKNIFIELAVGSVVVWLAALLFTIFYYGAGATGHFFTGAWRLSPFLMSVLVGTAIEMVFRHLYDYLVEPGTEKTKQMAVKAAGTIGIYVFCFLILTVMSGSIAITFLQITAIVSVLAGISITGLAAVQLIQDKQGGGQRRQKAISVLAAQYERECRARKKIGKTEEAVSVYAGRLLKRKNMTKWVWAVYLVFILTEFFFLLIYTVIGSKISAIEITGLILLWLLAGLMMSLLAKGSTDRDVLREVKKGTIELPQMGQSRENRGKKGRAGV